MSRHTKRSAAKHTEPHVTPAVGQADACRCVSEESIRLHAYQRWVAAGHPPGDGVRFWLEAEHELKHQDAAP